MWEGSPYDRLHSHLCAFLNINFIATSYIYQVVLLCVKLYIYKNKTQLLLTSLLNGPQCLFLRAAGNICNGKYRYVDDLCTLESTSVLPLVPVSSDCRLVISPLKPDVWEAYLSPHPDRRYVRYLVDGIRNGFHIGCGADRSQLRSAKRNMLSAENHPSVIERYLREELSHGRLMEIQPPLAERVHISKFGVIPKKHQAGKWRLIVDLSSPEGASVNDFIESSLCSLSYASVDDAASFVFQTGEGTLLAKLDIKSAYRNVPVHPEDRLLLGLRWQGHIFVDTCLPFGLCSAPKIFNATADALEWMIAQRSSGVVQFILHYLDDFLFGGNPNSDSCKRTLDQALSICQEIGFPIMAEKVVAPTTVIDFLGVVIDTTRMEIRLPEEKLVRLKAMINLWQSRKSCTKRKLLSHIGNLQHASTVVKPGRTFLRRMIDLSKRQIHLDSYLRLNMEFRADLNWWASFLSTWNGVSVVAALCRRPIDAKLTSDASGSWGCGAFFNQRWFNLSWDSCPSWTNVHISIKELLPIVISCAIWGREMSGSHIRCCDNAAVVVMVNKHTSSQPLAMHLLRCLFFICAKFNITLSAEHLAGCKNTAADALSRGRVESFLQQTSQADRMPWVISPLLLEVQVSRKANWWSAEWSRAFQDCI